MKRRNAETGKMRRPIKRTKITEGMYGNSMLYLKFVMLWSTVVVADYMLEFRFEFLWPFWMMFRSLYDSFKYQGVTFTVFFICIALTSDVICFFYIPMPWMLIAACTYVWVQCLWYTVADKGLCLPTVALCCVIAYVEGAVRAADRSGDLCRPFAAHCVGYPVVSLGRGFKSYVGARLKLRRQQQVREDNEYYFHLMREALPESALEESQESLSTQSKSTSTSNSNHREETEHKHMNGSSTLRHRKFVRPDLNHIIEHATLQFKLDKLEKHLAQQTVAPTSNGCASGSQDDRHTPHDTSKGSAKSSKCVSTVKEEKRRHKNRDKDKERDVNDHSHKSTEHKEKEAVKEVESTKENGRSCSNQTNHTHRDKEREKELQRERERELHRERELQRERERELHRERERELHRERELQREKERELHREKELQREKERELHREKEREKELQREREKEKELHREKERELHRERELHKERERELHREREREKELLREREKEREIHREREKDFRECSEELKRVKAELTTLRSSEAAAAKARNNEHKCCLAAANAASSERTSLERRWQEERRARLALEHQLTAALQPTNNGTCENETCTSRRAADESDAAALRRDLQRARERASRLARELTLATDQIRTLSQRQEETGSPNTRLASAFSSLQERATHLERALSAETRVKLDLLSALGEAKRHLQLQDTLIAKQEKEMQELKAQMLAVMPSEFLTPLSGTVSKLRLSDGSHLDPNASVYTPKQLCSDA